MMMMLMMMMTMNKTENKNITKLKQIIDQVKSTREKEKHGVANIRICLLHSF